MPRDWNLLPDHLQIMLAGEAMCLAVENVIERADVLAEEVEAGALSDHGGPDALRLLATLLRLIGQDSLSQAAAC
jgi:hypothetical protein